MLGDAHSRMLPSQAVQDSLKKALNSEKSSSGDLGRSFCQV